MLVDAWRRVHFAQHRRIAPIRYLQAFAASVESVLFMVEGLFVPLASRRWQSFASPPEEPEFWPFILVFLELLPLPVEFWLSLEVAPELPDVPVPLDPPDDCAMADVAIATDRIVTDMIFVNMRIPP
ncbi:hypothetical protein [Rhizobium sp. Root708]|uniref:hypothetical protein n=1 Tax=Rhizobium sp. Root708 TaxID=1736592 RepID=UPI0012E39F4F|nr:hypothetical protein [Rhizobium sp. Root708]